MPVQDRAHARRGDVRGRERGALARAGSADAQAVHIKTGKYYACKVISKQLMRGREGMIRNEITVLKALSQGHPNIVTLWGTSVLLRRPR